MSLILVVEPDSRHAAQFASMARNHLHAELVMVESGDGAVAALAHRVPDIVLTAPLLPHHDEIVLSDYLRGLGDAAAHVQTLTIPILSTPAAAHRGVRGRFKRDLAHGLPDGCDPALFAEQVGQYLHRARQRRVATETPVRPAVAVEEPRVPQVIIVEPVADDERLEIEDEDVEAEDVDLTPYLATLAEPDPLERIELAPVTYAPIARVARIEPIEPEPLALEPFEPLEPLEPLQSLALHQPLRAHVPQVITVPTGNGPDGQQTSVNVAVAVSVQVAAPTGPPPAPRRQSNKPPKPIQDEWGFFDPDQCGFKALLARLDAIAAKEGD